MDEAKTEVKEEIRQSRLIRKSTVQELAKRKRRRKKWRQAAQEALVDKEVEAMERKEKTKRRDAGDKERDNESLVKMSEYTVPIEPNYCLWAWILIPVLLGTSLIPLLMASAITTISTDTAYTVARGSLSRFAAVEFCLQRNMRLPLPTAANDTVSTMSEYWIRVENDGSQWVDSDTEATVAFTNWNGDTSKDFGVVNTETGVWFSYDSDHLTRTVCI